MIELDLKLNKQETEDLVNLINDAILFKGLKNARAGIDLYDKIEVAKNVALTKMRNTQAQ